MNHRRSIIAVPALAAAVFTLTATEATARVIPEDTAAPRSTVPHDPGPPNYPNYEPAYEVPAATVSITTPDDNRAEGVQAGAAAIGGAGLALAGMWLYRRRLTD